MPGQLENHFKMEIPFNVFSLCKMAFEVVLQLSLPLVKPSIFVKFSINFYEYKRLMHRTMAIVVVVVVVGGGGGAAAVAACEHNWMLFDGTSSHLHVMYTDNNTT